MKSLVKTVILIALLYMISDQIYAEDIKINAKIDRNIANIGEVVNLELELNGVTIDNAQINIPKVEGLTISQQEVYNASSFTMIVNGKQVAGENKQTVVYAVTSDKSGDYAIPPFEINVGKMTYKTKLFHVKFANIPENNNVVFIMEASKNTAYVYEPVSIKFKWLISKNVGDYSLQIPLLDMKDKLTISPIVPEQGEKIELALNKQKTSTITAIRGVENYNGNPYTCFNFSFKVYSTSPASIEINSATVIAMISTGMVDKRFPLGMQPDYKKVSAKTKALSITFKELPDTGKPDTFNNNIGKYEFNVSTSDTTVKEFEPIMLKLTIKGDGLLDSVNRPLLSKVQELTANFDVVENLAPGEIKKGEIVFEQIIRPKSMAIKEIPAIPFSFFNTEKERYEIVYSNPIQINVLKNEQVGAEQLLQTYSKDEKSSKTVKEEVESKLGGIYANFNQAEIFESQQISLLLWWLIFIPPLTYFIIFFIVRKQRHLNQNYELVRKKKAKDISKKYLLDAKKLINDDSKAFYNALSKGLGKYISNKFNLGEGELTELELNNLVAQSRLSQPLAEDAKKVIELCDMGRFGSSKSDTSELANTIEQVEKLINNIEKEA